MFSKWSSLLPVQQSNIFVLTFPIAVLVAVPLLFQQCMYHLLDYLALVWPRKVKHFVCWFNSLCGDWVAYVRKVMYVFDVWWIQTSTTNHIIDLTGAYLRSLEWISIDHFSLYSNAVPRCLRTLIIKIVICKSNSISQH